MINNVEIEGILHAAPQTLTTSNNATLCKLFLKHIKTYTNKFGAGEKISFVPVTTWGPIALQCKDFKKGDTVKVTGTIEYQMWETNGEKKGQLVVTATQVSATQVSATQVSATSV